MSRIPLWCCWMCAKGSCEGKCQGFTTGEPSGDTQASPHTDTPLPSTPPSHTEQLEASLPGVERSDLFS
jgi:hypothetical protein